MFIQTLVPPVAGEIFRFNVAGGAGLTSIEVYVGAKQILDRHSDHLPCRAVARIPPGSEGSTLRINATDSAGHNKTLKYVISESDPGPHSMLSRSR
jgi:hypothetical protein